MRHVFLLAFVLFLSPLVHADTSLTLCSQAASVLHDGDIVFRSSDSVWAKAIADASGGWAAHDAIAMRENGQWVIYEATFPSVRRSTLCSFFEDASQKYEIKRARTSLSRAQLVRMRQTLAAQIGVNYDMGFDLDNQATTFCSKYVYEGYLAALGFGPGHVQTFRGLMGLRPNADLSFWNAWFMGDIPWTRRTITPQNQVDDARFSRVFTANFGR